MYDDDHETLTRLNGDYISSVQNGDVRRFAEILADDFLCSHPDGTLVGKTQFLEQTARPVTIRGLGTEDVRIRILGDVAIIHARTRCRTPRAKSATVATPTYGRAVADAASPWRRT